jgi:hypothetical protein
MEGGGGDDAGTSGACGECGWFGTSGTCTKMPHAPSQGQQGGVPAWVHAQRCSRRSQYGCCQHQQPHCRNGDHGMAGPAHVRTQSRPVVLKQGSGLLVRNLHAPRAPMAGSQNAVTPDPPVDGTTLSSSHAPTHAAPHGRCRAGCRPSRCAAPLSTTGPPFPFRWLTDWRPTAVKSVECRLGWVWGLGWRLDCVGWSGLARVGACHVVTRPACSGKWGGKRRMRLHILGGCAFSSSFTPGPVTPLRGSLVGCGWVGAVRRGQCRSGPGAGCARCVGDSGRLAHGLLKVKWPSDLHPLVHASSATPRRESCSLKHPRQPLRLPHPQ